METYQRIECTVQKRLKINNYKYNFILTDNRKRPCKDFLKLMSKCQSMLGWHLVCDGVAK